MSLAVIIPVYNNEAMLGEVLQAVLGGTRVPDELVVVDDASTDRSSAVAELYGARVLRSSVNVGPAACRNAAAQISECDLLVFLDADTRVHPETIAGLEQRLLEAPALAAVIGSYDDMPAEPGLVSQFRNLAHHFVHGSASRQALTFWSGCGAVRRRALLRAGGFDARYRRPSIEDIELGYRLSEAGERTILDPSLTVTHLKRWTLRNAVRTDVLDRGAPWFELLLERRDIPNDLNVTVKHRLSTGMTALAWTAVCCAVLRPEAAAAAVALFSTAAVLHWDLLKFLARKRGAGFLVAAVPLHLLQQTCNIAAALLGTAKYVASPREKMQTPEDLGPLMDIAGFSETGPSAPPA